MKTIFSNQNRKPYFAGLVLLCLLLLLATGCNKSTAILSPACVKCHSSSVAEFGVLGAKAQYAVSGHNTLGNSFYANGGGCQRCHTNEGFVEFVTYGELKADSFVKYPSQPGCFTCHAPHENGDFALRVTKPVALVNEAAFDKGSGNICAACHQARTIAKDMVKELPAKSINANWGAHHGPQADIFLGSNAYEFEGKQYSSSSHTNVIKESCTACHMALPAGRFGLSPAMGGHSFNMAAEVHEAPKVNTAGCLACHKDMTQVKGKEQFDVRKKDFDLDGTEEPVQEEVMGLFAYFVNSTGTGYLQTLGKPFYKTDGTFIASTAETPRPVAEVAALYNYKMLLEDRSHGIHNLSYTIQVLYDSLQALDAKFDTGLRPN